MDPRASGGVYITRDLLGMAARVRCGGRNVCLAGDLSARLSLRRLLAYLERRVTIDSYTKVISLWSALILMIRVLVKMSVLADAYLQEYPQGREEYRDDDAQQIHGRPLSVARSLYLIRCHNLLVAGSESPVTLRERIEPCARNTNILGPLAGSMIHNVLHA